MEQVIISIYALLFGLVWGSFLNVIAYRVTFDRPFFTQRSACPSCNTTISFYDNIPVVSWILLRRSCRFCHAPISPIYPFIEITTGCVVTMLVFSTFGAPLPPLTTSEILLFLTYLLFFSALIIATATDLHGMIIPQMVTLYLIPVGMLLSYTTVLPLTVFESFLGACFGYSILWITGVIFKAFTHQQGIGEGDMELLAMIGSFLGLQGVLITIMYGSILGCIGGIMYLFIAKKGKETPIPFGPFLALGATVFYIIEIACQ